MERKKVIGVVGGVGPYAGLDLVRKIFDQTIARSDQEHLPVLLFSLPDEIEDRTGFLLGHSGRNPADSIVEILRRLEQAGATVAGIPCNTAHAPQIIDRVLKRLREEQRNIKLLNLIEETVAYLRSLSPKPRVIGVLSTTGSRTTGIYRDALEKQGFTPVELDEQSHSSLVQNAIYDPGYGIKAQSNPITEQAQRQMREALELLTKQRVDLIILGCTELPLAVTGKTFHDIPLVDPSTILARSLIREVDQSKLKP